MKSLANAEVDIWWVNQAISTRQVNEFLMCLSADEQIRAHSFYFKKDKRDYIASRYALRHILSHYLPVQARELQFSYSAFEKPMLEEANVYFNVSHSFSKAIVAIAKMPIGIDIEWSLREVELDQLAQRFFSKKEAAEFLKLQQHEKQRNFFYIWTKKEAVIKAIGEGLSYPLDQFHVAIHPEKDNIIFEDPAMEMEHWTVKTLTVPHHEFVAAMAVMGEVNKVTSREFDF